MSNLDTRAAWILLTVLALTAAIGLEQGVVKGLAAVREAGPASAPADPEREPVPRAQPLAGAPMDEAAVRQIARQEAEAAVARARPRKAAVEPDTTDEPDTVAAPSTPAPSVPTVPPPATAPAAPG